jgi:hypothetical protein
MKKLLNEIKKLKKYLISAIQKYTLKLILITINHNESTILINPIISRKSLINIIITISKLEKY